MLWYVSIAARRYYFCSRAYADSISFVVIGILCVICPRLKLLNISTRNTGIGLSLLSVTMICTRLLSVSMIDGTLLTSSICYVVYLCLFLWTVMMYFQVSENRHLPLPQIFFSPFRGTPAFTPQALSLPYFCPFCIYFTRTLHFFLKFPPPPKKNQYYTGCSSPSPGVLSNK